MFAISDFTPILPLENPCRLFNLKALYSGSIKMIILLLFASVVAPTPSTPAVDRLIAVGRW